MDVPDLSVLALGDHGELNSPTGKRGFNSALSSPQLAFSASKNGNADAELDEVPLEAIPVRSKGKGKNKGGTPPSRTSGGFWPSFGGKSSGEQKQRQLHSPQAGAPQSSAAHAPSDMIDVELSPEVGPPASAVTGRGSDRIVKTGPFKYPFPVCFDNFALNEATWPIMQWMEGLYFFSRSDWMLRHGGGFLCIGVFLAALNESIASGAPRYNVPTLLVLVGAISFGQFPTKSMRPFIALVFIVAMSVMLDAVSFARNADVVSTGSKCITALVIAAKGLAVYQFLTRDKHSAGQIQEGEEGAATLIGQAPIARARKFLSRRTRVFCITWKLPRRLMREVRNRILAIEVLQGATAIFMLTLFILSISRLGYNLGKPSNPHSSIGISPAVFLFVKAIFSGTIFAFLYADTDPLLAIHHYGCLGLCTRVAKEYIHAKREEYGGWPLAYAYNSLRFRMITWAKVVDVAWGIVGWVTYVFGVMEGIEGVSPALRAFFACSIIAMLIADVWIPLLFYTVSWLVGKQEEVEALGIDPDSDDSEIDELGLRNQELTPKANERVKEARRQRMAALRGPGMRRGSRGRERTGRASDEDDDDDELGSDDTYSDDEDDVNDSMMSSKSARSRTSTNRSRRFYSSGASSDSDADSDLEDITLDLEGGARVGGGVRLAQDQWGSPYGRVGSTAATSAAVTASRSPQSVDRSHMQATPHSTVSHRSAASVDSPHTPPAVLSPYGGNAVSGITTHGFSPGSPHMATPPMYPQSEDANAAYLDPSSNYEAAYGYAYGGSADSSPLHPRTDPNTNAVIHGRVLGSPQSAVDVPLLTLNHSASIDPRTFAGTWQANDPVGQFDCVVAPHAGSNFTYRALMEHLKSVGFFVVAAGKYGDHNSADGRKLYVYGEAFGEDHQRVYYQCELKIVPLGGDGDVWSLVAESKCQPPHLVAYFVSQLHLAMLFDLRT